MAWRRIGCHRQRSYRLCCCARTRTHAHHFLPGQYLSLLPGATRCFRWRGLGGASFGFFCRAFPAGAPAVLLPAVKFTHFVRHAQNRQKALAGIPFAAPAIPCLCLPLTDLSGVSFLSRRILHVWLDYHHTTPSLTPSPSSLALLFVVVVA